MTVVEFFDNRDSIENMVSTLVCNPDHVVFVGSDREKINSAIKNYKLVAKARGMQVQFSCLFVSANHLAAIKDKLTKILKNSKVCTFDMEGGEEPYLTAACMVYAENPQKAHLHRFSISGGAVLECNYDGKTLKTHAPPLTLRENVQIYGGKILSDSLEGLGREAFHQKSNQDIKKMWKLCRQDPKAWNLVSMKLDSCQIIEPSGKDTLQVRLDRGKMLRRSREDGYHAEDYERFLRTLRNQKLIIDLHIDEKQISFAYKNRLVRQCLMKAGQLLELLICSQAMALKDREGEYLYGDVMTGVSLDWDGELLPGVPNVSNEIDVMLIRGLIPVFISCKNGGVMPEELYKLEAVADRFGGKYAKKVLIVSGSLKDDRKGRNLLARAEEMDIRVVENISSMDGRSLNRVLRSLWR